MFDPSPIHIVVLLAILLLVFGSKRLPEAGRSLGQGIREFKGAVTTGVEDPTQPTETASVEAGAVVADTLAARPTTPATAPEDAPEQAAPPLDRGLAR